MRITAILREPGNWQTLQAWRFDDENKVLMAISPTAGFVYLCSLCLATVLLVWLLFVEPGRVQIPRAGMAFATFAVVSFAGGMYFEWKNSCAVMKLLTGTPRRAPPSV